MRRERSDRAARRVRAAPVVPGTGLEPVCLSAANFKSAVSTTFTTQAAGDGGAIRSRTGLTGFAIQGITALLSRRSCTSLYQCKIIPGRKKGSPWLPFLSIWSGRRGSNSRPQPWQGCALPTELLPRSQQPRIIAIELTLSSNRDCFDWQRPFII